MKNLSRVRRRSSIMSIEVKLVDRCMFMFHCCLKGNKVFKWNLCDQIWSMRLFYMEAYNNLSTNLVQSNL